MKERNLIFISHANPEDNEFASWLGTRLTAAGYEVWADVLTLLGGETFWRDIGNTIKKEAAVVIVALSHASYQKDGVLDEIALAVNTGRQLNKQQFSARHGSNSHGVRVYCIMDLHTEARGSSLSI